MRRLFETVSLCSPRRSRRRPARRLESAGLGHPERLEPKALLAVDVTLSGTTLTLSYGAAGDSAMVAVSAPTLNPMATTSIVATNVTISAPIEGPGTSLGIVASGTATAVAVPRRAGGAARSRSPCPPAACPPVTASRRVPMFPMASAVTAGLSL